MAQLKDLLVLGPSRFLGNIYGTLKGNADTATKLANARKLKTNLGSTTDVEFDGSADQTSIPVTGTLGTANGGTGNTSFVANRLVWTESATKMTAGYHYVKDTKVAIHSTSEPAETFYVNGTARFGIGSSDAVADKRFIIGTSGNRYLSLGGAGIQAYSNTNAASQLYINYNGGNVDLGRNDSSAYSNLTVWGNTQTNSLKIASAGKIKHIEFSRDNYNYITAPASGYIAFVTNGKDVGAATSDLVIYDKIVHPGATNTVDLGTSDLKWKNVYATTFHGALDGNANTASALILKSGRESSLNYDLKTLKQKVVYSLATSAANASKTKPGATDSSNGTDAHVLTFAWDSDTGWGAQLAVGDAQNNHLYIRGSSDNSGASNWETSWRTILDSGNYTNYTVTKNHTHSYLPLSGGQMTGPITFKDTDALPQETTPAYSLTIDSFANGGKMKWVSVANTRAGKDGDGYTISSTYIKKSIGTAAGDLIYWSAASNPARLAKGTDGQVLKMVSGVPAWAADNNTTYGVATTSANGLMSSTDKEHFDNHTYKNNRATINAATDWNTLNKPGTHKVQMSAWGDAATYHSPNQTLNGTAAPYSYGELIVLGDGSGDDGEYRLLQIYVPHNTGSLIWYRWHNGNNIATTTQWHTWTIGRLTDNNTDTKVAQTAITASDYTNWRTLIWGASNSGTEGFTPTTVTDGVYSASTLSVQPSTGTIRATTFKGDASRTQLLRNFYVNTSGNASSASRPTSANLSATGSGGLVTFKATSNMTTGKPPTDAHILHMYWDNTGGYDAQLAMSTGTGILYLRGCNGGTWGSWRTGLDSSNYTDYTVTKTGTGASGTWGINVTGSSASASRAHYLQSDSTIDNTGAWTSYFSGQIAVGSANGNAYSGSSSNRRLWSFPAGKGDYNGSVANVQVLRLGWGTTYWHDLFVNPNNEGIWHRSVRSGSADAWHKIWQEGDSVTGAVWNDYAEYRESDTTDFGYVLFENGDDTLSKTTERLQHFAGVSSDTWGFAQGETDKAKTPLAVAGRVLVYPYQDRNNYKPGDCVCAAPGGTVDIMTREEVREWPDRIVGTVSCVPTYEEWGGGEKADRPPIKVNNRIWIKVR